MNASTANVLDKTMTTTTTTVISGGAPNANALIRGGSKFSRLFDHFCCPPCWCSRSDEEPQTIGEGEEREELH
eukprot:scaffold173331_cov24-Attheya_sp.AAC.1